MQRTTKGVQSMQGNKTRARHEVLMTRMAETLGVDLDAAEMRGDLPPEAREAMLLACTGCSDPAGCARHLAAHPKAEEAPDFCRNRDLLRGLAAG